MRSCLIAVLAAFVFSAAALAGDANLIDDMESTTTWTAPAEDGTHSLVTGAPTLGNAILFSFDADCSGDVFRDGNASSQWDTADGISFWVKGDGSETCGSLEFIYNWDYAQRYALCFPIKGTGWQKVTVPWRDFLIETVHTTTRGLAPAGTYKPSLLVDMRVGKWWYWGDYPAHAYTIDEIRLEPSITVDSSLHKPAGHALGRFKQKLLDGQNVKIVTMGDSLTDFGHWSNATTNWPTYLKQKIEAAYPGVTVTLVNSAVGGTELRHNVIRVPVWSQSHVDADLVTVFIGYNDWGAGVRGPMFEESMTMAVDRARRATGGAADFLIMTTCPAEARWTEMAELAQAGRDVAADRNAGLADIEDAFHTVAPLPADRTQYFADGTHLSAMGQDLVADVVFAAVQDATTGGGGGGGGGGCAAGETRPGGAWVVPFAALAVLILLRRRAAA